MVYRERYPHSRKEGFRVYLSQHAQSRRSSLRFSGPGVRFGSLRCTVSMHSPAVFHKAP